ncbi:MAG: RNA polymerase sigma factor RpoH [Rhodospirillales bacterium]|nr:MAG: RNA polymerase sigma factor RpoH [Rhodospirillales bacterium]
MSNRRTGFQSPPDESVGQYIRRVQKYPLLTAEQEKSLAQKFVADGDRAASHALVSSHLRLVAKIAMGYRGYGLPVDELISQGNLGLMQAVDRFDPERGYRLSTYAMWWIRAAIQEYIVHSWSLVKMGTTSEQKKLFFNLRRIKRQIKAVEEGDLDPENVSEIAMRLKVPESEVVNMNRRLAGMDASLNAPLRDESESEWQDWLVDDGDDQEARLADTQERAEQRQMLGTALEGLSARERDIVSERHLSERPMTLEALSRRYGISRERVRQIEVGALAKLKKAVHKAARKRGSGSLPGPSGGGAAGSPRHACAA